MYGIQFSILHKFDRASVKRNIMFVSYAGVGGEIKRVEHDYLSPKNAIVVNLRLDIANVNGLSLNPENCASGFDKRIVEALKAERDKQLKTLVLCNPHADVDVGHLKFHEERRNSVEDICDMDVYTAEISGLTVKIIFTAEELAALEKKGELYSDLLAIIIEYPEATYTEKFRNKNGALRALEFQRMRRIKEVKERYKLFGDNGNVYNYFLNDPERRVGVLYVNHLGMVRKIQSVSLAYLKKGLFTSLGENDHYEELIVEIDDILDGKSVSYGVYLTEAQAKMGTNNSEENKQLTKELEKTQGFLKDKVKDLVRLTERAVKAEELNNVKDNELKLLKHELSIKELLIRGREQGIKNKEDVFKLKELEQRQKELNDNSFFGKLKRFFSGLFEIGKHLFGFVDGAAKAKTGAKVLGIG